MAADLNTSLLRLYRLSHEMPISGFQDAVLAWVRTALAPTWASGDIPGGAPASHETPGPHCQDEQLHAGFMHWIFQFRASLQQDGRSADAIFLAQLLPHILQAFVLNHMTHSQCKAPAGGVGQGLALTDLRGVVHYASTAFEFMLRGEWPQWRSGLLPAALLAHFEQGHERFEGHFLVVSRQLEHGLFFLTTRLPCRADNLTSREQTVARLIASGATHKQIALLLKRSPATVRNHAQAIYAKLAVSNIAGLIAEMQLVN